MWTIYSTNVEIIDKLNHTNENMNLMFQELPWTCKLCLNEDKPEHEHLEMSERDIEQENEHEYEHRHEVF